MLLLVVDLLFTDNIANMLLFSVGQSSGVLARLLGLAGEVPFNKIILKLWVKKQQENRKNSFPLGPDLNPCKLKRKCLHKLQNEMSF